MSTSRVAPFAEKKASMPLGTYDVLSTVKRHMKNRKPWNQLNQVEINENLEHTFSVSTYMISSDFEICSGDLGVKKNEAYLVKGCRPVPVATSKHRIVNSFQLLALQ